MENWGAARAGGKGLPRNLFTGKIMRTAVFALQQALSSYYPLRIRCH